MKKILLFALIVFFVASLTACMQKIDTSRPNVSRPESSSEISSEPTSVPSSQPADKPAPESSSEEPSEPEEGEVAVFDPETQTTSSEVIDAEEDLDAALVKALNAALGFDGHEIKVNDVMLENGNLTIDLAEDSMPLVGVGSSGEAACLKSIAVTFLKNYPEAELVYFTVDGGIYSSGHMEFAPGEPYMDRSMMD